MTGAFKRGWLGLLRGALAGAGSEDSQTAKIEIRGQRWLGPGEMLRVIEIEGEGRRQQFVLWTSRQAGQMAPIEAGPAGAAGKGQTV
ncbi:MAG: hypothetical protein ACK5TN_08880 [Acidobacteriota bacterium]